MLDRQASADCFIPGTYLFLILYHSTLLPPFIALFIWNEIAVYWFPCLSPVSHPEQDRRLLGGGARLVPLTIVPWHPAQCLSYGKCAGNVCGINEWMNEWCHGEHIPTDLRHNRVVRKSKLTNMDEVLEITMKEYERGNISHWMFLLQICKWINH